MDTLESLKMNAVDHATQPEHGSVTREQLYEMVWCEPMLRVGERFGVSSSYLARVCTELRVPRPSRGYWAKLAFGKNSAKPPLPPMRPGDIAEWRRGAEIGTRERSARTSGVTPATHASDRSLSTKGRTRTSSKRGTAESGHPLIIGVKPHFLKTRETRSGILRPFKRLLVDVLASKEGLDAALKAADSLYQALTARGHRVVLAQSGTPQHRAEVELREKPRRNYFPDQQWRPDRPTVVYIGDIPIGLTLFEMTEQVEMQYVGGSKYVPVRDLTARQKRKFEGSRFYWTSVHDVPSSRLCLQAYSTSWQVNWVKRWQETAPKLLVAMVPSIVKELEAAAPALAASLESARLRELEDERRRAEAERLRRQAEALALQETRRREARADLLGAISAWDESCRIAAYFAEVERAAELLKGEDRQRLLDRVAAAKEFVGNFDPLASLLSWKSPQERT